MSASPSVRALGVGIDTARFGHRASFLRDDGQEAAPSLSFSESRTGYTQLQQTLAGLAARYPAAQLRVRLDAAGQYAANLEAFLRKSSVPLTLSVGQPAANDHYRKLHFPKRKSDDTDSRACARFAVVESPAASAPTPPEYAALREVASRLEAQSRQSTRCANQLHNLLARTFPELAVAVSDLARRTWALALLAKYPTPAAISRAQLSSLEAIPHLKPRLARQLQQMAANSIASLTGDVATTLMRRQVAALKDSTRAELELRQLLVDTFQKLPASGHRQLVTIIGIGPLTAAAFVAKVVSLDRFETPQRLVGYFGVFPQEATSGVDKRGRPLLPGTMRMSTQGNDLVRKYLWNAAKSACIHNPPVRELYRRLRSRGTRGDVALGHCMQKLLHQMFAVWRTDQPFDPEHRSRHSQAVAAPAGATENRGPQAGLSS